MNHSSNVGPNPVGPHASDAAGAAADPATGISTGPAAGAVGHGDTVTLPPCQYEDSTNCYWDAATMGNGTGRSFVNVDGEITYTDSPGESDSYVPAIPAPTPIESVSVNEHPAIDVLPATGGYYPFEVDPLVVAFGWMLVVAGACLIAAARRRGRK